MKTTFSKSGMYLLVLTMFAAVCSCKSKEDTVISTRRGIAVKVKASKF